MDIKSYLNNNINCDNFAFLGYNTKNSGNSLPTVWDNLSVPLEVGTDRLSRNVGKELPLLSAK